MVKQLGTLFFLGINAWTDIKRKEISLLSVGIAGLTGLVWFWQSGREWIQIAIPIGIVLLFLALSIGTRGALGMGDVWIILAFAMLVEMEEFVMDLCMGILLAGAWSVILLFGMKRSRNTEIPFVPFLLAGYVGGLLLW